MDLIDAQSAPAYLHQQGWILPGEEVSVTRLAGGVSNEVFYVSRAKQQEASFVLKQARPQLRTPDPWYCGVERIWREVEVLRICSDLLDRAVDANLRACTPRILFEDLDNFAFAMTAAPREHVVWKQQLLAHQPEASARASGVGLQPAIKRLDDRQAGSLSHMTLPPGMSDMPIAEQCGRLLAALHSGSWGNAEIQSRLADRQIFDELRLDPYYRSVARAHPGFAPHLERLIASVGEHPLSLVHADFSPKNLLVYPGGLMMVDFETGHFGDPAFDLGFFLSHLVLKAIYHAPHSEHLLELTRQFWSAYESAVGRVVDRAAFDHLTARSIQHFAGCAWARIDGKSKVDYLAEPTRQAAVRDLCRWVLSEAPIEWDDVMDNVRRCRVNA